MSALVSHPTGNANLRAVLRGLQGADELAEFWTTLALPKEMARSPALPRLVQRRLSQRCFAEVSWSRTRLQPWREITRLVARGAGFRALTQHEVGWASVDGVYRALDRAVAEHIRSDSCTASLVYAYEDGALESFRAAHETGITCAYDLPIAYWRTLRHLLEEEAERLPEWACTMEGLRDSSEKHERKDAELELADEILVASSFTRNSLASHFGKISVHVTPYGCPAPTNAPPKPRGHDRPIELFFAGHLAQRKGIADLIAALAFLDVDWRLTMAGPRPPMAPKALDQFLQDQRVNWLGTVPHSTLLEHMTRAHVFVFLSLIHI